MWTVPYTAIYWKRCYQHSRSPHKIRQQVKQTVALFTRVIYLTFLLDANRSPQYIVTGDTVLHKVNATKLFYWGILNDKMFYQASMPQNKHCTNPLQATKQTIKWETMFYQTDHSFLYRTSCIPRSLHCCLHVWYVKLWPRLSVLIRLAEESSSTKAKVTRITTIFH